MAAAADGRVTPDALDAVLADDVALVSIMSANNETGVVQPLAELAAASHEVGALMHTDAAQAFGKIPLTLEDVDGVSLSAHKNFILNKVILFYKKVFIL